MAYVCFSISPVSFKKNAAKEINMYIVQAHILQGCGSPPRLAQINPTFQSIMLTLS